jgi:DNA-binding transcriptional ArsR family regulator
MSERSPDKIHDLAADSALASMPRLEIIDYLKRDPDATFEQMLEEFELNPNSLSFHLRTLREAGFLKTKLLPLYSVTEQGSERFDELVERAIKRIQSKY